jgi:hypothetical protein
MHITVFWAVILIWYMGTNIFEVTITSNFSVKLPEDGCSRSVSKTGTDVPNYTALHLGHSSNPKNVCSITPYLPNHMASHPRIHSNCHSHHCEKPKSYKIT